MKDVCESRTNHRHAVVVQDLATQWIQSCPCKTKTSPETERSSRKFLEPSEKPKVICTDNSLEFGKSCEDLSRNHRTSTPHRSETKGLLKVRRITEGTSAVLSQSGCAIGQIDSCEPCVFLCRWPRCCFLSYMGASSASLPARREFVSRTTAGSTMATIT